MSTAVVVGSGPNGLTAAVVLAQRGLQVTVLEAAETPGGGARSAGATVAGLIEDSCSAVHPFGLASPIWRSLDLGRHGLRWRLPEIQLAHPLDGGTSGVLHRGVAGTAAGLGRDGPAWRDLFEPLADRFDELTGDVLAPLLRVPRHPLTMARFGLNGLRPATAVARRWGTPAARALFAGAAAHAFQPLHQPCMSAIGLILLAAGQRGGWPVAEGGSAAITRALLARLDELGATVRMGVRVTSLDEVLPASLVLLDVLPSAAARICGARLPPRVRRAYLGWKHGPAAFKLDLAVHEGLPWTNPDCRLAGTVHLGGSFEEIAAAEQQIAWGLMPQRPFVLVAQQYLADPSRSAGDVHPVYAYAHVPHGYAGDATEAILGQIERYAKGSRDRIVGMAVRGPSDLAYHNANNLGGDIAGGAGTPWQTLVRPRLAIDPYATGVPGVYLCSASTPPGAGVHGMCGYHAAHAALRYLSR